MIFDFAIVGLGNPEPERKNTRHNLGFLALERLLHEFGRDQTWSDTGKCRTAKAQINEHSILLVLPYSGMNESGQALNTALGSADYGELILVYDDLDLRPDQIKVVKGAKRDQHRGVQDINDALGYSDYLRVRGGIGHPRNLAESPAVLPWVLSEASNELAEQFLQTTQRSAQAVIELVENGLLSAQQKFH